MSMRLVVAALAFASLAGTAAADSGHGAKERAFGHPGTADKVTRTIAVTASDDMKFSPPNMTVRQGETIRFVVKNIGKLVHEFSIGDLPTQRAHALMMKKNPDMKHDEDPTAVTLDPGETKELIWSFDKNPRSPLVFACQIPGHYDAGMVIRASLLPR